MTGIAHPSSKMGITGQIYPPPPMGVSASRKMFVDTITRERLNQSEPNFHIRLLTGIARPTLKMDITGHM